MRSKSPLVAVAVLMLWGALTPLSTPAAAGEKTSAPAGGIQWFARWVQAKAEAKRTKRPILLIAAAPHCRNVSGMW